MAEGVELAWPTVWSDELARGAHALIHAVTEIGGAIGWMSPPPREETNRWLSKVLDSVSAGDAALCVATGSDTDGRMNGEPGRRIHGRPVAMGLWQRDDASYAPHTAWLAKIMAHPMTRGLGLGAVVTRALIDSAKEAGFETLQLGVRGNNHLAIELYEELGFEIWGTLPNVIEVGDERFDDVRMFLEVGRPAHVLLRGGAPSGPGTSPSRRNGQPPHS